jgi:SagB-type dehydrogenase family enzyme
VRQNTWREYHELTKHTAGDLWRTQQPLDWQNLPDPFRHYEGVPVVDLPADPAVPETPTLSLLQGALGNTFAADGPTFLSDLLFYSAAISASKLAPATGNKYALRVNPSSGNLHPTEFHFVTRGLRQWPDGLYHYRPSSHMAEQRAAGDVDGWIARFGSAPIVFILTSIAWREAWKYGDRAYRYCLLDMGHAWQALALSAGALGSGSFAVGHFLDNEIARSCRIHEDEWPMLIIELRGASIPVRKPEACDTVWFGGQPNQLSRDVIAYPCIDQIHGATKLSEKEMIPSAEPPPAGSGGFKLAPPPPFSGRSFGKVARLRRSALDFVGGSQSISVTQLSAILAAATNPFSADFAAASFIQLYLYAHRVEGLPPGAFRFWRNCAELERIKTGDQRVIAAGLSLGQDLAGNACVAFSMIGDLARAGQSYGDRGYRYVHFEAGAIGHRLYLAAEALGLGAAGIGAFYDDEVHSYLDLSPGQGQVVYHFAIGYPVPDPRLTP